MYERKIRGSWIDEFMKLGADSESPMLYYKWVGISTIASALRHRVYIDRESYKDYPNMYVILVAPPGGTRKSTVCDFAYDNIIQSVPSIKCFSGRITTEALMKRLTTVDVSNNNTTILSSDPSLLLYASELSSLFKKLPKGSYPIIDFLTSIYGSGNFSYDTKNGGEVRLMDTSINLLAATTPSGVNELIGVSNIEGGFASRVILVYQDTRIRKGWPDKDPNFKTKLNSLISDLNRISSITGEMVVPTVCKRHWNTWYFKEEFNNPPPELVNYNNRKHDHLLKVAMVYALSERDNLVLTVKDLDRANDTLSEVEKFMPSAFNGLNKTKESGIREDIVNFIKHKGGSVTRTELTNRFERRIKGEELTKIMVPLIDSEIISICRSTNGRAQKYILNGK